MKLRIFIGSSSEGLPIADALHTNLDSYAEVTVWTQDVFRPSQYILESLIEQLSKVDLGIFVLSADDVVKMRGVKYATTRDNVIFELGLWIGRLGRQRCIIVAQKEKSLYLPSDLLGINYLTYTNKRTDGNYEAALNPASTKIRSILRRIGPISEMIPMELKLSFAERSDNLSHKQREILDTIACVRHISGKKLLEEFPEIKQPELTYRLENLSLQMFITVRPGTDFYNDSYRITIPFKLFLEKRRTQKKLVYLKKTGKKLPSPPKKKRI